MKIKEVEQQTGISKANIRFYEKEGLLTPARQENKYWEYSGRCNPYYKFAPNLPNVVQIGVCTTKLQKKSNL